MMLIAAALVQFSPVAQAVEPAAEPAAEERVRFNDQIRPILSDRCFYCHGPDPKRREAELRLDDAASATAKDDDGAAIVPGDADASLLIRRVTSNDPDEVMPPPDSKHGRLTDAEVALIRRWISEGAEFQPHWAFAPLNTAAPPEVKAAAWVNNPIDNHVLAKLEAAGIAPSPEADRAVLARRAALDLTGLLPDPESVIAFENDARPDAYERYVEELLASPYFGERWGRHWLDQARYADSNGYSIDAPRAMWPYRDWVIGAIQDDMPFDQFTLEQLAGDLLPDATKSQRVASGFHRNTLINQEGGTDPEQFRHESVVDRVNTTGAVWLGLTVACAQCHTHKFDPISDREYYELFAFFNSGSDVNSAGATVPVTRGEMLGIAPAPIDLARAKKRDGFEAILRERLLEEESRAKTARAEAEAIQWRKATWPQPDAQPLKVAGEASFEPQPDGSLLLTGKPDPNAAYDLAIGDATDVIAAIRLRVLADDRLPARGPGWVSNGNFVLTSFRLFVDGKVVRPTAAFADHSQPDFAVAGTIDDDPKTGWAINVGSDTKVKMNADHEAVFLFDPPIRLVNDPPIRLVNDQPTTEAKQDATVKVDTNVKQDTNVKIDTNVKQDASVTQNETVKQATEDKPQTQGDSETATNPDAAQSTSTRKTLRVEMRHDQNKDYLVGRFLIETSDKAPPSAVAVPDAELLKALNRPAESRSAAQRKQVIEALRKAFPDEQDLLQEPVEAGVMVMAELKEPRSTFVSIRGDFLRPDRERGEVRPGGLAVITPRLDAQPGRNRIDLAKWLVDPSNPLTPRVTVNRVWMRYFGKGLVETEEDFGTQGTPPTHPELLDWLATYLRDSGWSMKSLHRAIVTSSTYRQASRHRSDLIDIDANNRLLARQNRLRVEAEIVRDAALSASGQWHAVIGGPSVHPPQPEGVYAFTQNVKSWVADKGGDRFRRGIYTEFYRSAPHPLFTTFDTPDFQTVCTRRNRSNTPLQALTVANDEAFVELARAMAARVLRELPDADNQARIAHAFRLALSRQPSDAEAKIVQDHYIRLVAGFTAAQSPEADALIANDPLLVESLAADSSAAAKANAAAWVAICRTIINTDNFITRE